MSSFAVQGIGKQSISFGSTTSEAFQMGCIWTCSVFIQRIQIQWSSYFLTIAVPETCISCYCLPGWYCHEKKVFNTHESICQGAFLCNYFTTWEAKYILSLLAVCFLYTNCLCKCFVLYPGIWVLFLFLLHSFKNRIFSPSLLYAI